MMSTVLHPIDVEDQQIASSNRRSHSRFSASSLAAMNSRLTLDQLMPQLSAIWGMTSA